MKRIFGTLQRRPSSTLNGNQSYPDDSPEAKIIKEVSAFCESGRDPTNSGTEFVHLPAIVESAESSPNAAKEAAYRIRKLLSDPAATPGYVQYNALMLVRILIDNPGHTFTRNLDAKFVSTTKDLLRNGRDMGVQHFLRETLNALEAQRSWDEDLRPLVQMWAKEKDKLGRVNSSTFRPPQQQTLPPPDELAARISEAKTSAKLLIQFAQSTPVTEFLDNELMKEFCDRCRSASRSVQTYIHSTNPTPDEDTLTTLIETNDELSVALSKHHHAFLRARKMTGGTPSPSPSHSSGTVSATASGARPLPPPPRNETQSPSTSNGTPSASGARPMPPPRNDVQSPSASGTASAPGARLPQAQTTRSPEPDPAPAPITASPPSTTTGANTYEYRSEDFQVQNPFADSFATEQTNPRGDEMNTQRPAHVA